MTEDTKEDTDFRVNDKGWAAGWDNKPRLPKYKREHYRKLWLEGWDEGRAAAAKQGL